MSFKLSKIIIFNRNNKICKKNIWNKAGKFTLFHSPGSDCDHNVKHMESLRIRCYNPLKYSIPYNVDITFNKNKMRLCNSFEGKDIKDTMEELRKFLVNEIKL